MGYRTSIYQLHALSFQMTRNFCILAPAFLALIHLIIHKTNLNLGAGPDKLFIITFQDMVQAIFEELIFGDI